MSSPWERQAEAWRVEFGYLQSPHGPFAGAFGAGGKLKLELKRTGFEFKL